MALKISLYPKTKRVGNTKETFITEKMDGSNLGFFIRDGMLHIATRNNIFRMDEIQEPEVKQKLYKGLHQWLEDHHEQLTASIIDGGVVFGEWRGMGQLSYQEDEWTQRFIMFAKARIDEDYNISKLNYNPDNYGWVFEDGKVPEYIGTVPLVLRTQDNVTKEYLDALYDQYSGDRENVEGFIVIYDDDHILKYVRRKHKKLVDHKA